MRLLRGEDLETVSREVGATAAALTRWRDAFLTAGEAALEHGVLTTERLEIERLKACLDDVLSDRDLLKKRASAKACPPQPCQADGEQSGDEAIRTRVAAEVEILSRHYAADSNPLFVWKAIRLSAVAW
jgi:hypothetical protein